jgi:hypothetical protein
MIEVKDLRKTFRAKDKKSKGSVVEAVSGLKARALLNGTPDPSIWHAFALFSLLGVIALWSFIKAMREAVA